MYQPKFQKHFELHPISYKLIGRGHPWITQDKFSDQFPPASKFVVASKNKRPYALLLNDPSHKEIKARVWAKSGNFQNQIKTFKEDLAIRMKNALKRRVGEEYTTQRNHFYLIFGEGDYIPGIFVHYINGEVLIQFYMAFWRDLQDHIVKTLIKEMRELLDLKVNQSNIWIQYRSHKKSSPVCLSKKNQYKEIMIQEYGVNYHVTLGQFYDHGIYTDMSAIRSNVKEEISKANSMLNLFSYTGAFSLFAMKQGVKKVTSVDLSETYINWLEKNIEANEDFKDIQHNSMIAPTKKALEKLINENAQFDFIVTDPPSSSSDGKKRTNALSDYTQTLPMIKKLLSKNGKALIFLNTHRTNSKKFETKIESIIKQYNLRLKISKKLNLTDDCPQLKGFPEGAYLKGLLLSRL